MTRIKIKMATTRWFILQLSIRYLALGAVSICDVSFYDKDGTHQISKSIQIDNGAYCTHGGDWYVSQTEITFKPISVADGK